MRTNATNTRSKLIPYFTSTFFGTLSLSALTIGMLSLFDTFLPTFNRKDDTSFNVWLPIASIVPIGLFFYSLYKVRQIKRQEAETQPLSTLHIGSAHAYGTADTPTSSETQISVRMPYALSDVHQPSAFISKPVWLVEGFSTAALLISGLLMWLNHKASEAQKDYSGEPLNTVIFVGVASSVALITLTLLMAYLKDGTTSSSHSNIGCWARLTSYFSSSSAAAEDNVPIVPALEGA